MHLHRFHLRLQGQEGGAGYAVVGGRQALPLKGVPGQGPGVYLVLDILGSGPGTPGLASGPVCVQDSSVGALWLLFSLCSSLKFQRFLFLIFRLNFISFSLCMSSCGCVYMCASVQGSQRCQISWNWSCRQSGAGNQTQVLTRAVLR